jgi:hypothetical protein
MCDACNEEFYTETFGLQGEDPPMHFEQVIVAYHRNGVSSMGFHVVTFRWRDGERFRHMVATVFEEPGYISVFDIDALAQDNIAFAQGNSWRGDDFEATLREHIATYSARAL